MQRRNLMAEIEGEDMAKCCLLTGLLCFACLAIFFYNPGQYRDDTAHSGLSPPT